MEVKHRFITIRPPGAHNQAMLDNSTMAARIKTAIESSGQTQASIAAAFGITEQAVSGWIRTGKVDKRKLPTLAKLTQRPLSYFMPEARDDVLMPFVGESEPPPYAARSREEWEPVVAYAQAVGLGAGAEAQEYAETHALKFKTSSLRKRGIYGRSLAIYYGQGDSMEPTIKDGDAIMFDTSDTRPVDGSLFVVQVGREVFVKRAEILDGIVYFRSDNPHGDHAWRKARRMDAKKDPIVVVGRVHWIGAWAD